MGLAQLSRSGGNNAQPAGRASVSALPGRSREDAALVERVSANRDRSALTILVDHYGPRLKAWLVTRGEEPQTAEDIVQDVFIQIWVKANSFDPEKASFSTWAYRITRNKWIDHRRKYDRILPTAPETMTDIVDEPQESADVAHSRNEAKRAVREELALLPPEQKQMLQLAFFEGLSHGDIAARTGVPLGTVKSRIRLSLKKMQSNLRDYAGVDDA